MKFTCTRDSKVSLSASEGAVKAIGGGIVVPSSFPYLGKALTCELVQMDSAERIAKVLSLFMDEFSHDELCELVDRAYESFEEDPCQLMKVEEGLYLTELWHGGSGSAEDISLALYPYLFDACKKKLGIDDDTIVIAAEGAEGAVALLDGYNSIGSDGASHANAKIAQGACFYPLDGTNDIHRLMLATAEYNSVIPVGVDTDLANLRAALKRAVDENKGKLGSYCVANASPTSILRVLPLTACVISAYCDLLASEELDENERINLAIPVGEMQIALAGYYAKSMGLPIANIILATNANNAVVDLLDKGELSVKRDYYFTMSHSMDVLLPDNLEALIYFLVGCDSEKVKDIYAQLRQKGHADVELDEELSKSVLAGWADEQETAEAIFGFFDLDDCLMDTHTAVTASVYNDYSCDTEDDTPTVIMSPSNPYLYAKEVLLALGSKEKDGIRAINRLKLSTALECPERLEELAHKNVVNRLMLEPKKIAEYIKQLID